MTTFLVTVFVYTYTYDGSVMYSRYIRHIIIQCSLYVPFSTQTFEDFSVFSFLVRRNKHSSDNINHDAFKVALEFFSHSPLSYKILLKNMQYAPSTTALRKYCICADYIHARHEYNAIKIIIIILGLWRIHKS